MKSANFRTIILFIAVLIGLVAPPTLACCSLHPADFSDTVVYAGEAVKDGKTVHLLGYQNKAENRNARNEPNAMLLPIPAKAGTMTSANIVDTSKCKSILQDMKRAVVSKHRSRRIEVGRGIHMKAPEVQVFEHDIYTIVLAQNAAGIPDALNQVPENRRPALNKEIFTAYSKWYPGNTFALCCFNTADATKADPMLWWYEPLNQDELFCPALDAHNGKVPRLNEKVKVDHVLIAGSHLLKHPLGNRNPSNLSMDEMADIVKSDVAKVSYTDESITLQVKSLLPACVIGEVSQGFLANGDFVFKTSDVRQGVLKVMRKEPPGAGK